MILKLTVVAVLTTKGLCFDTRVKDILKENDRVLQNVNIIDPDYTDISNYPFNVAVVTGMDLLGGGALIRPRWVLTAASVVNGFNLTDLRVRAGSNSPHGGHLFRVVQVILYPDYHTNRYNNVALLKLISQVNPKVGKPISTLARVPFQDNESYGNMTGYGRTTRIAKSRARKGLQIVQMELYTNPFCNRLYNVSVPSVQFCGLYYYGAPCNGDEGDPITRCIDGNHCELLGVYTGFNQCQISAVSSFVDLGQFYYWIRKIVKL